MRKVQFIAAICLSTSFFACQQEEITVDEKGQSIKQSITLHKDSGKTVELDYKIEDKELIFLSDLPTELQTLQNENMHLQSGADSDNWLRYQNNSTETANQREAFDDQGAYDAFIAELGLGEINHYGFVIDNKETGLRNYGETYGIHSFYLPVLSSKKYFKDGVEQDYTVDLSFGFSGGNQLEILNVDSSQENLFANEANNGLHHIAFSSDDVEASIELFNNNGYETVVTGEFITRSGLVSKIAFLDTRAAIGVYTEIVESRLFGLNVEQDQGLLIFGLFIGDTKLYCL